MRKQPQTQIRILIEYVEGVAITGLGISVIMSDWMCMFVISCIGIVFFAFASEPVNTYIEGTMKQ